MKCKDCQRDEEKCGTLSRAGLCVDCGTKRRLEGLANARQKLRDEGKTGQHRRKTPVTSVR